MKAKILSFPLLAAVLAGCGGAKPVITNTHADTFGYVAATAATTLPVDVTVDPRPLTPAKETPAAAKTFADWPDSVKHIYLKAMVARTHTPQELVDALRLPLTVPEKKPEVSRQTKFDEYKMVFEFANVKRYDIEKYAHPGTRLEVLVTTLDIDAASYAYFNSIDKLQNEFEDLDLGSLERTQNVQYNVKGNLTGVLGSGGMVKNTDGTTDVTNNGQNQGTATFDSAGHQTGTTGTTGSGQTTRQNGNETTATANANVTAGAEASYLNNQTIKEAVGLKGRQMMLGFALTPKQLTVSQHSRPNTDISTNVFVTANLKFKNSSTIPNLIQNADVAYFSGLFDADDQPVAASELTLNQRTVTYVDRASAADVKFTVGFSGKLRAVGNEKDKSGNNFLEYDDHITYYPFEKAASKQFELDKNEFAKTVYKIKAKLNGHAGYLYIAAPVQKMLELFGDESPELVLQWLNDQLEHPVAAKLKAKKFTIFFDDRQGHTADVVAAVMTPVKIAALAGLKDLELEAVAPPGPRASVGGN